MLSAPPIQASSAGTAHLRSVPRYKSGCNKWFKTICWFLSLFFCFVIYVSFYLGTLSSVFKDCFFELIVAHSFLFRFMYSLTCTFFWSMHLCLHFFMETRIYSFMFLICLLLYSFIFWTNSLIVLGNDLFFSLMFRLCSLCIHCFMQHTICCIHLVFFT